MGEIRIGVINWDCSLPSDTFFGFYSTKSLSPRKYRDRTPYYADVYAEDKIDYHVRSQEEYDRELEYAVAAGIDYFAYAWYTEEAFQVSGKAAEDPATAVDGKMWELTYARKMHTHSKWRKHIKMCAILICLHKYTDEDLKKLSEEMEKDSYEHINGRPLVYLFGGYRTDYMERLQKVCRESGQEMPYIVFMNNGAESPDGDYLLADGVSTYACGKADITRYGQLSQVNLEENEDRKKYGVDVIPFFTVGWDPSPRVDNPVPWTSYPDASYAAYASQEELMDGAKALSMWINANAAYTKSGHILTNAWNEFEEGGYLCPLYVDGKKVNTQRIEVFAEIVQYWKRHIQV